MFSKNPHYGIPLRRSLRAALCALPLFLLPGAAPADEAKPAPAARDAAAEPAVSELTAAYAKLGGFIATYRSEAPGKSLDATLAADFASGFGAIHVVASTSEHKMEVKQWNAPGDRFYAASAPDLFVFKGINEQMESIWQLGKGLAGEDSGGGLVHYEPFLLLEKSVLGAGLGMTSKPKPSWLEHVMDASIEASDDKSVTFQTKDLGLLTISRDSGMLVRQSLQGDAGEARVLELKSLQLNPGKDAVAAISANWPTANAEEKPATMWMIPMRMKLFQAVVDLADTGDLDLEKLKSSLEAQYEVLRHFAEACIEDKNGRFAAAVDWPKLFKDTKSAVRLDWLAQESDADAADDKAFLEYLRKGETRLNARNDLVETMMKIENIREPITDDMFGRGGWASLKVGSEHGVAAKKVIVTALVRAYLEALVDQKMDKQWDRRDGLD